MPPKQLPITCPICGRKKGIPSKPSSRERLSNALSAGLSSLSTVIAAGGRGRDQETDPRQEQMRRDAPGLLFLFCGKISFPAIGSASQRAGKAGRDVPLIFTCGQHRLATANFLKCVDSTIPWR